MTKIYDLERKLGIYATYLGYYYLAYSIKLTLQDETYLLNLTRVLYPEVARKFNVSTACVERNIRTAISVCWKHGNREFLNNIAGYVLQSKPTNGEFIAMMTGYLKQNPNIED